jgi:transglutaminase-like putative cysteine protease
LAVYLRKQNVTTLIDQVARSVAASAGWNTSQFLVGLNEYIFKNFAYEVREEGMPFEPEKTLLEQRGSCRDFAVFFVACCQTLGLAARFVSGYQYLSPDKLIDPTQPQDLHAWAEVYLPGGGWRGFDPTQNASVTDSYIPLAASAFPQNVSPITGTFAGNAGFSFNAGVQITQNV